MSLQNGQDGMSNGNSRYAGTGRCNHAAKTVRGYPMDGTIRLDETPNVHRLPVPAIALAPSRAWQDVNEGGQRSIQTIATDMVEIAETFRRELRNVPKSCDIDSNVFGQLRDSFAKVERSFLTMLSRNGIEREDPTGFRFDPDRHQKISEQPSPMHAMGTIIETLTCTWTLNGHLLRPAMVIVSK